ncbi:MAG: hemolysin family protein [Zymomonas mobilis subsp. pomaceae]|uniref:hemolysin family protein n=1 Tax=Zymomonas mobilis TaxID=542 RepID=UPI0039E95289
MTPHPSLTAFPWHDCLLLVALIAFNGLFAMSELAIISSRRPKLEAMTQKGNLIRGAKAALALSAHPGRFLSTMQVGITGISTLAGAVSGETLGGPIGERLALLGVPNASVWGFAVAIVVTTYFSLIFGELVPKQVALRAPEQIAAVTALPVLWLSRITAPAVWLLDKSSAIVFRLAGMDRETHNQVTAEEVRLTITEAFQAGVIEENERQIISGVIRLADRPVREIMTPRTEVGWLDMNADVPTISRNLASMPHSRMPVAVGSVDNIIGVVHSRDIVRALMRGEKLDLKRLMRSAPVVPDQTTVMAALDSLRLAEVPLGMVHDEYGHFEGVVAPADLLAAMSGHFVSDAGGKNDPSIIEDKEGHYIISGSLSADQMADKLNFELDEDRDYATVAGFALSVLRHLPTVGERFSAHDWQFEILDITGHKIEKIGASRVADHALEHI